MKYELNIGLEVKGEANDLLQVEARAEKAIDFLKRAFPYLANQLRTRRFETQYENDEGVLVLERSLYAIFNSEAGTASVRAVVDLISEGLEQDCIAMFIPSLNRGVLVGPRADAWGDFNPEYFKSFTGDYDVSKVAA